MQLECIQVEAHPVLEHIILEENAEEAGRNCWGSGRKGLKEVVFLLEFS